MSDHYLMCRVYIKRRTLTVEWCQNLLRRLWERGLNFIDIRPQIATWEEHLGYTWQDSATGESSSLEKQIETLVAQGAGTLSILDKSVSMTLMLDPNADYAAHLHNDPTVLDRRMFGTVELTYDTHYLGDHNGMPSQVESMTTDVVICPHQQVFQAFTHWFEVLGIELDAAFGFGFVSIWDILDENLFFWGSDGGVDAAVDAALREGHLPNLQEWLTHPRARYAAPRYSTPELQLQWLADTLQWVRQLTNGGLLACVPLEPYEQAEAEALIHRAHEMKDTMERRALYRRTMIIYQALGDEAGIKRCQNALGAWGA